ncbi:hypothetical protein Landi51_02770 [Colletotrichum acutatum]
MPFSGVVQQGLALLFKNPHPTQKVRDGSSSCQWYDGQLVVNRGHLFSNASRPITSTRQVTTIGSLRRPSIYAGFTMANFLRMAKVMDVNSVDTHSVAGSDVNMPTLKAIRDCLSSLRLVSRIPRALRVRDGALQAQVCFLFSSSVTRFGTHESQAAWASENPLGPLDELPPRPSRPILGYRSSERTADALLKPTRLFQLSIDSQPEYDFGVAQQTWEDCYGDYDDDSHIIAVRDVDNIRHHIPSHPPGELYCTHAGFSGVSSICAEAHQEHQRPELITEVIGEIEEFLFDHKLGDFQEVLARDHRTREYFIACKEPLPLRVPAKNKPSIHTSQPVYPNAEAKPLFTINEEDNYHGNGPFNRSTLPTALPWTKHNGSIGPSMAP